MELSIKERLVLLSVLPPQGDVASLKIVRQLREDLSFSEEEQKEINLKSNLKGDGYSWDKEIFKDVSIGEKANDLITDALKENSKKKQLHISQLEVYEKFIKEDV